MLCGFSRLEMQGSGALDRHMGCRVNGAKSLMTLARRHSSALTLLEMMIAVAIVADLAIIALPAFDRARKRAQNGRFINDLRIAASAFEIYATERDGYPPEAKQGAMPKGMESYLNGMRWTDTNALGGQWDWDYKKNGSTAAICSQTVQNADTLQMGDIDAAIDNGILATGNFRKRNNKRFAYIIE